MDTRFLETFVTVVENGSLAEAARRMNLSATAISQRIQSLETEIGTRLLIRSGKNVKSTEAGLAVLNKARNVVRDVRDLRALATGDVTGGELFLGATSTAMTGVVPDALKMLAERHPGIYVHLVIGKFDELYQSVLDGRLDASILPEPPGMLPKSLDWQVLWQEPLVLLAPQSMRVTDANMALRTQTFIRYDRNSSGGRLAERYLRQHDIHPQERFELYALQAIAAMVDRGVGISLVPDWAPAWPKNLAVKKIPVGDGLFVRRVGLVWSRTSTRARLIGVFLREAQNALAQRHFKRWSGNRQ